MRGSPVTVPNPPARVAHEQRATRAGSFSRTRVLRLLARAYTFCQFVYMALRHKHLKIDQRKLDRAKRLLRLSTEQETVDRALDAVLAEDAIVSAHQKARRVGGVVDPFGQSR